MPYFWRMSQRVTTTQTALLKRSALLVLVLLYSAGTLKLEWLHRLIHEHEPAGLHSVEQESNPCHQAIYHAAAKQACEHPTHLTADWKCPVCDIACQSHLTSSEIALLKLMPLPAAYAFDIPAAPVNQARHRSSPRAPPVC